MAMTNWLKVPAINFTLQIEASCGVSKNKIPFYENSFAFTEAFGWRRMNAWPQISNILDSFVFEPQKASHARDGHQPFASTSFLV